MIMLGLDLIMSKQQKLSLTCQVRSYMYRVENILTIIIFFEFGVFIVLEFLKFGFIKKF